MADTEFFEPDHRFNDPTGWAHWEPAERAAAMERLADALERRAEEIVQRVSGQNGMPVAVARQLEGAFPVVLLRYYAGLFKEPPVEETRPGLLGGSTLVRRESIGVVGAIVPWNFPQTLAAFKYAPAMAAGCTLVIKPSPETTLDSYVLAEVALEADSPPGVINIVQGGRELGAYLSRPPQGRQDQFHRVDGRGPVDRRSLRQATAAGHPRIGRQVRCHRAR